MYMILIFGNVRIDTTNNNNTITIMMNRIDILYILCRYRTADCLFLFLMSVFF